MFRKKQASVRTFLLAFGSALLIPVLAFAAVVIWNYAKSERAQFERQAQTAAHNLIGSVDLELSKLQVAIEALATSPSIQAGDYQSFQNQALNALRLWSPDDPNRLAVVLRDLTSQQLANTRVPWGQPLPRGANPNVDQDIIKSRRPVIQGIFIGATAARPIASIRVPVFTDHAVTNILSIAIEPERFVDLMGGQKLSPDWVLTIVDRNDRVVARSRDQERYVGQLAPEPFRRTETADSGLWVGPNLDGTSVLGAYERSPLSGWRAFVGLPTTIAEQPLRRSLWLIGALGATSVGLSYVLAIPFGRRIAGSAQALASGAARLGCGEPVQPVTSGLKEMDEVSRSLVTASSQLQEREAALKASENRLRATHDNAAVGIVEVDEDGRLLYVNEARCRMSGHSQAELLGRRFADFAPGDDPDEDPLLFRRQVAGELGVYSLEKRHLRADGSVGWARMSSSAVRDDEGRFIYAVRVIEDITERKEAEFRQNLLVEELNHRVKNTLATVQSLAFQTFRGAGSQEDARQRFEARLMALSRTHNLLNESTWTGASLNKVLAQELEPYAGDLDGRLTLAGPQVELPASEAVAIGMICHELATNAAKHGALSVTSGRVNVEWTVSDGGPGASLLHLQWIERDGPPVLPPEKRGFGSRLIEQTATQQLGGRVALRFEGDGLRCELQLPLADHSSEFAVSGAHF